MDVACSEKCAAQVFALTVAPLVAFYAGFALFLFPSADMLHPHGLFAALAPSVPIGLHGLLKVRGVLGLIRQRSHPAV